MNCSVAARTRMLAGLCLAGVVASLLGCVNGGAVLTPPSITSPAAMGASAGDWLSYSIAATGSPAPTFSVISPLPPWLTFDGVATLSGRPLHAAQFTVDVVASNGVLPNDALSVTVDVTTHLVHPFPLSSLDGYRGVQFDGVFVDDQLGGSVCGVGDVNSDGFADFIVSAHLADVGANVDAGQTFLVQGGPGLRTGVSPQAIDDAAVVRIDGIAGADGSGDRISGAGDVNGDGYGDFLIGAPAAAAGQGEAYLVYGGLSIGVGGVLDLATLDGTNGVRFDGEAAGDNAGSAVSGAGDVNGDGYADLVIASYNADDGLNIDAGRVYLVFGAVSIGVAGVLDLSTMDGVIGVRFDGVAADDRTGYSASGAGDVDGDGYVDLIIGAYKADVGLTVDAGQSYIVFGGPPTYWDGSGVYAGRPLVVAGEFNLSALDATNGVRLEGIVQDDWSGIAVSSAGDVDADGYADVLVGAVRPTVGGSPWAGQAYLVYGGATIGAGGALALATLDGTNGVRFDGVDPFDGVGGRVSSAGDVNGDGFADMLIGARGAAVGGLSQAGHTYLIFGMAGMIGTAGVLSVGALTGADGIRIEGIDADDRSGSSVSSAGDVDGDGYGDFLIGALFADVVPLGNEGETYLVFGGPTTPEPSASVRLKTRTGDSETQPIGYSADGSDDDFPFARAFLDWLDGAGPSQTVVTWHRQNGAVSGLPAPYTITDIAKTRYELTSARTGATALTVTIAYTDAAIAGLNEASLHALRAGTASGPWTTVTVASLDTARNRITLSLTPAELGHLILAQ